MLKLNLLNYLLFAFNKIANNKKYAKSKPKAKICKIIKLLKILKLLNPNTKTYELLESHHK